MDQYFWSSVMDRQAKPAPRPCPKTSSACCLLPASLTNSYFPLSIKQLCRGLLPRMGSFITSRGAGKPLLLCLKETRWPLREAAEHGDIETTVGRRLGPRPLSHGPQVNQTSLCLCSDLTFPIKARHILGILTT